MHPETVVFRLRWLRWLCEPEVDVVAPVVRGRVATDALGVHDLIVSPIAIDVSVTVPRVVDKVARSIERLCGGVRIHRRRPSGVIGERDGGGDGADLGVPMAVTMAVVMWVLVGVLMLMMAAVGIRVVRVLVRRGRGPPPAPPVGRPARHDDRSHWPAARHGQKYWRRLLISKTNLPFGTFLKI